ncbi:hypothetical protein I312_101738 [Cryptococcus bacillisporus CA1280]|uniref:uncharacterized protein n=1 Tax=Cryptococcus bacillisporus CA1280 TaxID=1296109 RepID=UPI003365CCCE
MGVVFSSSKSSNYIYPAIQSSYPPTRVYRIEVYKICRLVKQFTEDERKPRGVRVIIKTNPVPASPPFISIDIPYPPSVYQQNPSELRLRPMLLGTKTSTTSLRRSMPKSNNKGQVIINHPQPQKFGLSGLEKAKYIPTSRINTLHFDKNYDIKDIVTAIDATINEVGSPTPMKYTVTGSEGTTAPSVVSTPVRLIRRPFTTKSSLILPQSGTSNRIDTDPLASTPPEIVTGTSSEPNGSFHMNIKAEVFPATTTISSRSTLTSEADSNSIMETTISEPSTVISTPEAHTLDEAQIANTLSDSILNTPFGSLNFPVPTVANRDVSETSYTKICDHLVVDCCEALANQRNRQNDELYYPHPKAMSSMRTYLKPATLKKADNVFSPEKIEAPTPNTAVPLTIIKSCRPSEMTASKLPKIYAPFATRDMCVNFTTPLNARKSPPHRGHPISCNTTHRTYYLVS